MKAKIYLPKTYDELKKYNNNKLLSLWKRYFKTSVCNLTRQSMLRPLWYNIQCENMNLSIKSKYITKLNKYSKNPDKYVSSAYPNKYNLLVGTEIRKTYKNQTYKVTVKNENKFEYESKTYQTLSAVAKVITARSFLEMISSGLQIRRCNV